MPTQTSYLGKIRRARSISQMALYVRAQGAVLAPMLRNTYTAQEAIRAVAQYEERAETLERCETVEHARRLLSGWGF